MSEATIALSILIGLTTSVLFAYVGFVISKRPAERAGVWALRSFSLAWYAGSVVIFAPNLRTLMALGGWTDATVHIVLDLADNLALAVALGCLVFYLVYLVTGRQQAWKPVAVIYATYLLYLDWFTLRLGERTVVLSEWQSELTTANPPTAGESLVFGVLLALPVLFLLATYAVLAFRVRDASQRYRMVVTILAFTLLFASILVSYALHWDLESWFALTYEIPGLIAAILVTAAVRPPRFVQAWLRVQPIKLASEGAATANLVQP